MDLDTTATVVGDKIVASEKPKMKVTLDDLERR